MSAAGHREFTLTPFSYAAASAIARELALAEPVAIALVRRGYETVEAARAFLAADESHDPSEFAGIADAVALIRDAIARGELITVHGDYDVDGVAATTILVSALRELGADCDWLIPGRLDDGYGLTESTIDRLAKRGTRLLVTVDCGITSGTEIAAARARGIEAIVTDHHQPSGELPDCPIVHPVVSGYPCPDLCAAGVAHKLAVALLGAERAERDLDLVALATVADMVPLTGENRSLVRRGLDRARRAARPGLRALMAVARIAPERLDEGDLGFRLAPRINAAGRLYRADGAVELFLTADEARAGQIAAELDRLNHERRQVEAEVLEDAQRRLRELGPDAARAAAVVLWGEGWHPGVVGICASRMAEQTLRPTLLIALDGAGRGTGSGRSVPGFDLLGGLAACQELLTRFGGHRAAAGLEIERANLEPLRARFTEHAAAFLGDRPPSRIEPIDAVVGGESLGHGVADQLARLGPFGKGNPEPRFLVPGARLTDVTPMGEGDRHARFILHTGPARASGVAFGVGSRLVKAAERGPLDVSARLELNEWNGAVFPRVVLGEMYPQASTQAADFPACSAEEYAARLVNGLSRGSAGGSPAVELGAVRQRVDRTEASAVASVAALASSGEPVLVMCADVRWRRALVETAASPERFGGGDLAIVSVRGSLAAGEEAARRLIVNGSGGVVLADWPALAAIPDLARDFDHVVLADPAPDPWVEAVALAGTRDGGGWTHTLASATEPGLAIRALELRYPTRAALADVYRALRARTTSAPAGIETLREALDGVRGGPRSPEWASEAIRALAETGVLRIVEAAPGLRLEVVSSVRGELERSPSFVANREAHEECVRFLTRGKEQSSSPMPAAA